MSRLWGPPQFDGDGDGITWDVLYFDYNENESNDDESGYNNSNYFVGTGYTVEHQNDDWLVTPPMQINSESVFSFWAAPRDPGWSEESFNVFINTNGQAPAYFTDEPILSHQFAAGNIEWENFVIPLENYSGQTIYIGIQCDSYDQNCLALDDIIGANLDGGTQRIHNTSPRIGPAFRSRLRQNGESSRDRDFSSSTITGSSLTYGTLCNVTLSMHNEATNGENIRQCTVFLGYGAYLVSATNPFEGGGADMPIIESDLDLGFGGEITWRTSYPLTDGLPGGETATTTIQVYIQGDSPYNYFTYEIYGDIAGIIFEYNTWYEFGYNNEPIDPPFGRWDAYLSRVFPTITSPRWCYVKPSMYNDHRRTITEPGNAHTILTVGSMNTKDSWVTGSGINIPNGLTTPLFDTADYTDCTKSFFSSNGPTRPINGNSSTERSKPDLYAPGAWIASNSKYVPDGSDKDYYFAEDNKHYYMGGTSMAAPHVTGAIALLFQKYPGYDVNAIKAQLLNTTTDECVPNMLNIANALDIENIGSNSHSLPKKYIKTNNIYYYYYYIFAILAVIPIIGVTRKFKRKA